MDLSAGTLLNHYRILGALGAGGMGEVYEAEDTRLKRRIALKVLPHVADADSDRYARFEREAQALAALNHPSIVTIHSVEQSGDTHFLTMELVEGTSLDRRIPARGLPPADFLKLGIAIVDAVGAAHDRGIVHRDLKPANVMITPAGGVKVLDFGLAKLASANASPLSITTTVAAPTVEGRILGTVAYMSPEQAEGRPGDQRSDIFSLGILLYEMAAGVRPFTGETTMSVLSSIIKDTPKPPGDVNPAVPVGVGDVIERCLAKDPAERYQSAKELRAALEDVARRPAVPPVPLRRKESIPPRRKRKPRRISAVLVIVGAIYAARLFTRSSVEPEIPAPTFTRMTFDPGTESWPSLSPDGSWLVYAADTTGDWEIYLRAVGEETAVNLTKSASSADTMPAFSPDGRRIAFRSNRDGGGIFIMGRLGESVRRLTMGGADPAWTPDGREILYGSESGSDPDARFAPSELWAVDVESGKTRKIAPVDAVAPRVSPDGKLVAYWALPLHADGKTFAGGNRDVWVRPVRGGDPVRVTDADGVDWNPTWARDGQSLFFSSDRGGTVNLWQIEVDPDSGRPRGDARPLTTPAQWAGLMSVSGDGTAVAYAAYDFSTNVGSIGFDPTVGTVQGQATNIITGTRGWIQPDVSPDGTLLAMKTNRAREEIYVVGVDGSGLRAVTTHGVLDRLPRWLPDGRSIVFYSARKDGYQIWSVNPDGSDMRQLTHRDDITLNYPVPSPDGRWIGATNPNTREQYILDAHDFSAPLQRLPAPPPSVSAVYLYDWSPDGTRIAAHESPTGGLWTYEVAGKRWERIASAGIYPRWLPDGQRVVAPSGGGIVLVDTRSKQTRQIYSEPGRRITHVALSPDGRRLYYTSGLTRADIWMMRFQASDR